MKFIDLTKIYIKSGKGGAGCVSFCHEKYREFGGPDGGDGGKGGDIYLSGNPKLNTLLDLKYYPHQFAKNGSPGKGKQKTGRSGVDKYIQVPLGTLVYNHQKNEFIAEILEKEDILILIGGRGGQGNLHFKTSTNRAPRMAQIGECGSEMDLRLELKMLADVGLVGFPNAGKSTLISTISNAKSKVADYPFTTLTPNLGVVKVNHTQSFVIADIPGLIKGSHQGIGLGIQFLKHIQRTSVLAFLIDCTDFAKHHPIEAYRILIAELNNFSAELMQKKQLVFLSKVDAISKNWNIDNLIREFKTIGISAFPISSVSHIGLELLKKEIVNSLGWLGKQNKAYR